MTARLLDDAAVARHLSRPDLVFPAPPVFGDAHLQNARRVVDGRFLLIGEEYRLSPGFSWADNPSRDKEWQIAHHKHYFSPDLLHAYRATSDRRYLDTWSALTESWLDEMDSGFIAQSDAQVEAKRLENWVHALEQLRHTDWPALVPAGLVSRLVTRMGEEAAFVADHLKPVRNHRTFQLYAMFLVGTLLPIVDGAAALGRTGVRLLTQNLLTDFHADGVHIEMSTHYHQLVTETAMSFAEVSAGNGIPIEPAVLDRLRHALTFCAWFRWPDGDMPLLGDSDTGDLGDVLVRGARFFGDSSLLWAGTCGAQGIPPAQPSRHFPVSGYVVMRDGWGSDAQHIVYDQALIGEGSHSHYDLFSFTYHAGGRPVIIDPGRFTYSSDPDADGIDWRHHFKSTAAHNTVAIDGCDQTRYLSRTKHGPEIELLDGHVHIGATSDWVWGRAKSHEYEPVHERLFVFVRREYIVMIDWVEMPDGGAPHLAQARLHLASDAAPVLTRGSGASVVDAAGCRLHILVPDGGEVAIEPAWVSRVYGVKERAQTVVATARDDGPIAFTTIISPAAAGVATVRRDGPAIEVVGTGIRDRVTLDRGAGVFTVAAAGAGGSDRDVTGQYRSSAA